jgi:hypothetical protein
MVLGCQRGEWISARFEQSGIGQVSCDATYETEIGKSRLDALTQSPNTMRSFGELLMRFGGSITIVGPSASVTPGKVEKIAKVYFSILSELSQQADIRAVDSSREDPKSHIKIYWNN